MSVAPRRGYRTFAVTGQKVSLTSGSVPNLSGIFCQDDNNSVTQQRNIINNGSYYHTSEDIRRAVQRYMSASASDITRLNNARLASDLRAFHRRSSDTTAPQRRGEGYNSQGSSRTSSRASSPAPSRHLDLSIRVSTPDDSGGKLPPTGRGRPPSPNISMIRAPRLSVFYFNDDFTFDEDTSQAEIAENMLNDLTISSVLEENNTTLYTDDKSPINSSNSDGGYVSSELSDNTVHDSPKIDVHRIQEARHRFTDTNNNGFKTQQNLLNRTVERRASDEGYSVDLYLTASDLETRAQQESQRESERRSPQDHPLQRTVSKMSDDVFTEASVDDTMRFSELKLSEVSSMASTLHISSMASTLHNDDLESNISYDIRINDTMGIPMVSTLKRQDAPSMDINLSLFTDNTLTQQDLLQPDGGDNETLQRPSIKTDIPLNKNWTQERSSSFSGLTQLQRLKENRTVSYGDVNRIRGEHCYVKRNDSFVKSIENVSPWKGRWTGRNVTFDETANQKFQIESRQERRGQRQTNTQPLVELKVKQSRPPPPNRSVPLTVRGYNKNQRDYSQQKLRNITQQSNRVRHLHNTSAPSVSTSSQVSARPSLQVNLEPQHAAYNRSMVQEGRAVVKDPPPGTRALAHRGSTVRHPGRAHTNANYPSGGYRNDGIHPSVVSKDHKYPTVPRNFGGQNDEDKNRQSFQQQRAVQRKELVDEIPVRKLQNQNQRIVRQYYNQFYNQSFSGAPNTGHPSQHSGSIQQIPQQQNLNLHVMHSGQIQMPRSVSNPSIRSTSSVSSSPARSRVSPDLSQNHRNFKQNTSKNRSARRKLRLSDDDVDTDDGGFNKVRRDGDELEGRSEAGEAGVEGVTRHPAVRTIREPHRWIGSGYQDQPVRLSCDRGFLQWHHPKGTLDVMIYYGLTGEDFSCFIEHQLPGVDVFYVHPTGRKELILDGTRSDHDSPDNKRSKSHWSQNFNRNKEIRSWAGQVVLRLEPLKYFPCQSFKLPYFLAL